MMKWTFLTYVLAAASDSCSTKLDSDCAKEIKQGTAACQKCAEAHEANLKAVGCTIPEVEKLCGAPGPAPGPSPGLETDQKLIMLPTATAKCSDGSPIGYFFRPAPAGGQKNKLTIWLKGGAACMDYEDCITRQSSSLGSSKFWLKKRGGEAIQSTNKTINPDFFDWNHVYIEYCSGDFWSGTSPEPINPFEGGGQKFVFAGQLILSQVLDHLAENGLDAPDELIFTGGSAGGIGAINNADWLAAKVPSSTKYRVMPQGGFFGNPLLDFPSFVKNRTAQGHAMEIPWLNNFTSRYVSSAEKKCLAGNPSFGQLCSSPVLSYPYTTSPMFLVQAAVDYEQVFEYSGAPLHVVYSNSTVEAYMLYSHGVQAGNLKQIVVQGSKVATDGLFAPACLGHTTVQMGWLGTTRVKTGAKAFAEGGSNPKVDGLWAAQAFGDWYFGKSGNHMHLDGNANIDVLCSCNTGTCGRKPM